MIACTNTESFVEERENYAYNILVEHLEPFLHAIGSDMTLFGLNFKFQEPPVILVVVLINFGVKVKHLKSLSNLLLGIRC